MEESDFSKVFHQSSKNHYKGHPPIPWNSDEWPKEWKTTYYKVYPRLPKIELPKPELSEMSFKKLVEERQSRRDFRRGNLNLKEISSLLAYTCGNTKPLHDGRFHRAQASGGAEFPIETYLVCFRSMPELQSGVYHYDVKRHQLEYLWERSFSDDELDSLFTYPWTKEASFALIFTAVFSRNQQKYGERGYRYILIEAGHIGQNGYLACEALQLKCCALGGTKDEEVEKVLDIDGISEAVVYALAVGK